MGNRTWKPGNHHWIPEHGEWAKQNPRLWEAAYSKLTTPMSGEEHVVTQKDERIFGPIGSVARYDLRRWSDTAEYEGIEDEDLEEDY